MTDLVGMRTPEVTQRGGFVYSPPAGLATKDGVNPLSDPDYFLFRACDDPAATTEETNCAVGLVFVNIAKVPPVAVDSEDAVTFTEPLAKTPLELSIPAILNVMILFDDTAVGMQTDLLTY